LKLGFFCLPALSLDRDGRISCWEFFFKVFWHVGFVARSSSHDAFMCCKATVKAKMIWEEPDVSWCSAKSSINTCLDICAFEQRLGRATKSLIEDAHCSIGVGRFDLQLLCEM